MGARGLTDTERVRIRESTKQGSWELTKSEAVISKSTKDFSRSFAYMLWFQLGGLGTPDSASGVALLCLPLESFSSAELLDEGLIMILMYLVQCLVLVPGRRTIFWGNTEVINLGKSGGSTGKVGGRGCCSQEVLRSRRINKN